MLRKWHGHPWAVLLTLSLGFFMVLLDLTIVNIAVPDMLDQLDASLDEVLWVVNAYTLVLAVLLITAGRLGDLRGQRNLFIAGVAIFTVASFACGVAQNPAELITARAVQGLGAAALMPQTMAIIVGTFPADRRGTALGIWGAVAGLATVAGPTLGGLLVTAFGWRWIFFINVPVGVLVLVLTFAVIPDTRMERRHKLDVPGVLIATAALFCFVFALTEGERFGWAAWIWALFAASFVLLAVFLGQQRKRQDEEPLVPFSLFRSRNFTIMNIVGPAVSLAILGFFLPTTIYLQSVLGFTALKAGLVLAPASLVSMVVAPFAGRFSDRIGGKFILFGSLVLFAIGIAGIAAVAGPDTSWVAFQPALFVLGLGMGGIFAPMATEAMRSVEPQLAGAASGVNNTLRQVGSVIGSAAVGAVLQARLASALLTEAEERSAAVPAPYREGFVDGFAHAGNGLEVGAGQSGAAPSLPPGVPADVARAIGDAASQVFRNAYVDSIWATMALPIAVIAVAAVACLFMTRTGTAHARPAAEPAVTTGS